MALGADFRAAIERHAIEIAKAAVDIVEQPVQQERVVWEHNEPAVPFPPHEGLSGLEYTKVTRDVALDKDGWARPIYGRRKFAGSIWFPQDHPGCQCAEPERQVTERIAIESFVASGDTIVVRGRIDAPPARRLPAGVPGSIQAQLDGLLRNDLDDEIDDGTLWAVAVRQALPA